MASTRTRSGAPFIPCLRSSLLVMFLVALPAASSAQLVLGQYEDEAPLRSWNIFGPASAASLGRGETQLAFAEDASASLANPALLLSLPKSSVSLNASYARASLFRYSIVNTGVLATETNPSIGAFSLDFAGISITFGGWAVGLSAALVESYDRPGVVAQSDFQGLPYYEISFGQTGYLRTFNLALARKIGTALQAGIGFNIVHGELHREIFDRDFSQDITISQLVDQTFTGFFVNAGVVARISRRLDLGCALRSAYDKRAAGESLFRYQAPGGGTDILIDAAADSFYRQPWAAGMGARYSPAEGFRLFCDLTYFFWSKYRAEFFGETARRDFRDTFRAGAGGEWIWDIRLFGGDASVPLRFGVAYDRQPMREPASSYTNFSLGTGIRWGSVVFDIGGLFGRESGSGHDLRILRVASSLCLYF